MNTQVFAEDVNFWQTGKSSPDIWIERAKRQIVELGGVVVAEGFGSDAQGKAAYMLGFDVGGDRFKIVWPVLPSKGDKHSAARVQAATMLYHYVKSVCLYAVVVGARSAFFAHLMLRDGRMASQVADDQIAAMSPAMLLLGQGVAGAVAVKECHED